MKESDLSKLAQSIASRHNDRQVDPLRIQEAMRDSLAVGRLIDSLAEALRLSPEEVESDLRELGLEDLLVREKLRSARGEPKGGETRGMRICSSQEALSVSPHLFHVSATPSFEAAIPVAKDQAELFSTSFEKIAKGFVEDSFAEFVKLYRDRVLDYHDGFMASDARQIDTYVRQQFRGGRPKYLITTGIGANEQFSHFVASINNASSERLLTWLIVNSPRQLLRLPQDATVDNTLFMEFSRSSLTEETVKIHEYTPRACRRIVFCNEHALKDIGNRDKNLILRLPDKVAGRYGRNKTPILLAPMHVAGMDTKAFWESINAAIERFDICSADSLPMVMAKYIYLYQRQNHRNLIYLGCNDDQLLFLADELVQFWNEGVNKGGNDLLLSRFFGLPRDSHMNIEGILGNRDTKMGIFLLRTNMRGEPPHPMISKVIDPINPQHKGLNFGDEEVALAVANYRRFAERMPTVLIEVPGKPTLEHAAVIGQLFADTTYIYSRFMGLDPGSNPEVKAVRERSASLLATVAGRVRQGIPIEEAVRD